jgi:hypothetical protein
MVEHEMDGFYVSSPRETSTHWFQKIGIMRKEVDGFYEETIGYRGGSGDFPETKSLEDLELIVNRMNAIFRGEEIAVRIELLAKLIERRAPELVPICHTFSQLSNYKSDTFRQIAHLCETPEEVSLYHKIVPKIILLSKDDYRTWISLHPNTKLVSPAFRFMMEDETYLSPFEEMVWKRELTTEKDRQIFYGAARI